MTTHLLLVDSPDEVGLVYRITGALARAGFNITSNHEFVDAARGQFFMRTEFAGPGAPDALVGALQPLLPVGARVRVASPEVPALVLMATKEPHCLGDLLLRHEEGDLPARIAAVVSNRANLGRLAERFGIPFHHVGHEGLTREDHDQAMLAVIEPYRPEYLVLAKYMRVLSPGFVARYPGRIVNIHHSFLPAFIGARPYQQAFDRGVKIIGATAHVVTDDLDTGPIIAQGVLPVTHAHTAEDMARAGRDVEKTVLARGLKLLLEQRVFLRDNRAVVFE